MTKSSKLLIEIQQEVEQLATTEVARDIKTTEAEPRESDTPVEENEEGMLDRLLHCHYTATTSHNPKTCPCQNLCL